MRLKKEFEYETPRLDFQDGLHHSFKIIQHCIENNFILSGHDKSDGGLITTLLEMAFSSNKGLHISLPKDIGKNQIHEFLFNEMLKSESLSLFINAIEFLIE